MMANRALPLIMSQQYFHIGKIVASFGLKGELILEHSLGKSSGFKTLEVIFVENRKDSFLPYFVEEAKAKGPSEVYLKLEGVDTKEAARSLNQKEIWLQEEDFTRLASKSTPISMLGYTLFNGTEELGEIEEVIEQPMQVLAKLTIQNKEVLIPLHAETLKKVDKKNKTVYVELPEGLLDIYLGG